MSDSIRFRSNDARSADRPAEPTTTDSPEHEPTPEEWRRIEARFRLWSFRVYYARSFAGEHDPLLRFAKALIASTAPIRDRDAVLAWNRKRLRRYRRKKAARLGRAA